MPPPGAVPLLGKQCWLQCWSNNEFEAFPRRQLTEFISKSHFEACEDTIRCFVCAQVFAEKMGLETGWNCHISLTPNGDSPCDGAPSSPSHGSLHDLNQGTTSMFLLMGITHFMTELLGFSLSWVWFCLQYGFLDYITHFRLQAVLDSNSCELILHSLWYRLYYLSSYQTLAMKQRVHCCLRRRSTLT